MIKNFIGECAIHFGGKMRVIKTILGFLLGYLLLACGILTTLMPSPPPEGNFICYGTENGMGTQAGELLLNTDGTLDFNAYEGTWEYNADTHELTFEGIRYLATGIYRPDQNFLILTLKPDEVLSHAETGTITCSPGEE